MGKKSDEPDLPDFSQYSNLAREEAQLERELRQEQTRANRPTQVTPYGTSLWTELDDGRWRQDVTLPEEVQASLEAQQRLGAGRSALAETLFGRAEEELGAPIGWEALSANEVATGEGARDAAERAIYERSTSRLDPMWQQREQETYTQLWNQGLRPGDEAWDTAMGNLSRERTDAYQTAMNEAIMGGGQEAQREFNMDMARRQLAVSEQLRRRGLSLEDITELTQGARVDRPTMPGFQAAGTSQAPQLLEAQEMATRNAIDDYNARQMRNQSLWSGLVDIGTAGLGFAFSDRRLKQDIRQVGATPGGQPLYEYTMFGQREVGVMADESPADAVFTHPSGYLMVDYSRIK